MTNNNKNTTKTQENSLVFAEKNEVYTSSRLVAQRFEKEHRNVLADIRAILTDLESTGLKFSRLNFEKMFILDSYTDDRGRTYPEYIINRDGFTLLAMGFTGKKALEFKLQYIEAFNEMEKTLSNISNGLASGDTRLEILKALTKIGGKTAVQSIEKLFPEYYEPSVTALQETSERNTSYVRWLEDRNITLDFILDFPTDDIYENYMRYCVDNRYKNTLGKKTFYKMLTVDFNLSDQRKQRADTKRYFVAS